MDKGPFEIGDEKMASGGGGVDFIFLETSQSSFCTLLFFLIFAEMYSRPRIDFP